MRDKRRDCVCRRNPRPWRTIPGLVSSAPLPTHACLLHSHDGGSSLEQGRDNEGQEKGLCVSS